MKKRLEMTPRCWCMVKVAAIVLPWLVTVVLPALALEGFALSPGRCAFFLGVMVPFGNLALLGMYSCAMGFLTYNNALCVFAGIVAPCGLALLFASYWRRWQFVLVWVGYVVLIAWDALVASFLAALIVKGGGVL